MPGGRNSVTWRHNRGKKTLMWAVFVQTNENHLKFVCKFWTVVYSNKKKIVRADENAHPNDKNVFFFFSTEWALIRS